MAWDSVFATSMKRWGLDLGLFNCCSPCHSSVCGEDAPHLLGSAADRPLPYVAPPYSAAQVGAPSCASARIGWTPRAAAVDPRLASTTSPAPPSTLLLESTAATLRSGSSELGTPSLSVQRSPPAEKGGWASPMDPSEKAAQRARLRRQVSEFAEEATKGRCCAIVTLGVDECHRRSGRYELRDELGKLVLLGQSTVDPSSAAFEEIGVWPLHTVIGAHRAEESALVQSREQHLTGMVSKEELNRAAVLEFGGGSTFRIPVLIVEVTTDARDNLVNGMRILRLYRGKAQTIEHASQNGDGLHWPAAAAPMSASPPASPAQPAAPEASETIL